MPIGREPSLGELAEDFKEIRQDLKEGITNLTLQIRDLDASFTRTFLRKDLYEAQVRARDAEIRVINARISELDLKLSTRTTTIETEAHKRFEQIEQKSTANWRLGLTALVFPALMVIFTLIMTRTFT